MKNRDIKNLIRIKHQRNGKKSLRNPFEIKNGAVERYVLDVIEEKRMYKNACECGIDKSLYTFIKRKWRNTGHNPKDFGKLGVVKCMQILNK